MAISPVNTISLKSPTPVLKTDALATQFNAATKAGEKAPIKPVLPFYTPEKGRFVEDRKLGGNLYGTTIRWSINEDQGITTSRVKIKGTLVVSESKYKDKLYKLDPERSFINRDGSVHYTAIGISKNPYKMKTNVFNLILKKVESAIEQIKKNKVYFQASKKNTPVSLPSGQLTAALNFAGERNIGHGVGLNGVGKLIKEKLNAELSRNDKDANSVLIRKSIALAMKTAGVTMERTIPSANRPDADAAPYTLSAEEIRNLHVTLLPEIAIDGIRIANTPNDGVMNDDDIEEVYDATVAHYYTNGNAVLRQERITEIADAYFDQLRMPRVITTNGIPEGRRQIYRDIIFRVFNDNWNGTPGGNVEARQDLQREMGIDNVPQDLRGPAEYLFTQSPIYNEERLRDHLEDLAVMINDNSSTVSSIASSNFNDDDDDATSTITSVSDLSAHSSMGLAASQWSFGSSSGS